MPYGDTALLINFAQAISPEINLGVVELTNQIENAHIPGINFCTPAYCSITIGFDATVLSFALLKDLILTIYNNKQASEIKENKRKWRIPVCYEPPYSLDLNELASQLNISEQEIIDLHTGKSYHVYMLGFLPGFAYMGVLPDLLNCNRKENPRLRVPAQSVGLAGLQTGIYPMAAPGGWQIIGRTPIPVFNVQKEDAFLFRAGDEVKFYKIEKGEFEKMENDWSSVQIKS